MGPIHFSRFVLRVAKFKAQTFPKRIRPLIKPLLKNSFPQLSKALGHERVQFTLVGLFSGSQLQQTFPELILEPKEERKTFYKSNLFFLFLFLLLHGSLKKHKVEKVTQSTCWTPLTTSTTSPTSTTSTASTTSTRSNYYKYYKYYTYYTDHNY